MDEKLFLKISDNNFHIFEIISIEDFEKIQKLYPRKEMIRDVFKSNIAAKNVKITLPIKITIEIFLLLSEFCIKNKIEPLKCCTLFKIIADVLKLFSKKLNKNEIYENFKKFVLTFAMNRFSVQIGVLKKETIHLITDFFIEVIYKRFFMIHYCLTNKDKITLETRESISYDLFYREL